MELLYYNANVLTMDCPLKAHAVLTRDGVILAVGEYHELSGLAAPDVRRIDLQGRTLLPAFLDPHSHFAATANSFLEIPLSGCADLQELIRRISDHIRTQEIPAGQWVKASGYDHNFLVEKRHPTAAELDLAAPNHPLVIQHSSGHMGVFNTAALQLLQIPAQSDAIPGGLIQLDGGRPTGYLEENAFLHFLRQLPMPDTVDFLSAFSKAQQLYASYGITTVQEGMFVPQLTGLYQSLLLHHTLSLDVVGYSTPEDFPSLAQAFPRSVGQYHHRFKLGGYKIFLDGSPQGRTAWLRRPYEDAGDYCGYPTLTDSQVYGAFCLAVRQKRQLLAHCNGDAACEQMISAAERAIQNGYDVPSIRPVMIHAQILGRDQLPRLKSVGILPSFFLAHIYHWGDVHWNNLGPDRAQFISPAGSARRLGIPFTLHQDTPVLPPDMMESIWCAAVRRTRAGRLLGEQERIPVLDALKAVTRYAAMQYFEEDSKGSITPGKQANFVLLSGDPLSLPRDDLPFLTVLATILQDHVIYRRPEAPL